MRTLYLDCGMGASGNMLTSALYELLEDNEKKKFLEEINSLGLTNVVVSAQKTTKCGIEGTYITVLADGVEEGEDHNHNHEHEHEHEHNHDHNHYVDVKLKKSRQRTMSEIEETIKKLPVSEKVKNNVFEVYKIIAEAESAVHGVEVTDVHFHEVGMIDAIVDVTAVCILIEKLEIKNIISSAVHVGSGHVRCKHGVLPVPAPATAHILRGVPIYGGGIKGELCTPTGAGLLKFFVDKFGEMPVMKVEKIGYGMGKKDFTAPNCVRAMIGTQSGTSEEISELVCNIDDMTAESISFATKILLDCGALDVYTMPINMKKNRPGTMLCVMCKESQKDEIIRMIFRHTTTLGIRENICRRYTLERSVSVEETSLGKVRIKYSSGYGVKRKKYEYDDISAIAEERGLSLDEVAKMIEDERK